MAQRATAPGTRKARLIIAALGLDSLHAYSIIGIQSLREKPINTSIVWERRFEQNEHSWVRVSNQKDI